MADFERFKNIKLNTESLGNIKSPAQNSASNLNGLSNFQRFAVKNIFDTQPKKAKAYLERLGYDVSPDGQGIRPEGNNGKFQPIEPDDGSPLSIFTNLFTEKGREEILRDFGDVAFDTLISGPLIGAGAASGASAGSQAGGAIGTAAGAGIGAPFGGVGAGPGAAVGRTAGATIGGVLGGVTGGAVGNASAETIKAGIGEFLLDNEVPTDSHEIFYQSMIAGSLGVAGSKLGNMVKNWKGMKTKDIAKSLKTAAIQKSNGKFNANLMDDFAENPQSYTPEAVEGSTKKLLNLSDEIFGTSVEAPKSTRQLTGGIAKDAIVPLNKRADLEIEKLGQNPEANFTIKEIVETIENRLAPIKGKSFPSQEDAQTIKYFDGQLKRIKKISESGKGEDTFKTVGQRDGITIVKRVVGEELKEIPFNEGRDLLKSWQNAAFVEGPTKGNKVLHQLTKGLKETSDQKAGLMGSDLPAINQQRSQILSLYDTLQKNIRDGDIQNAFIGKDSISKQRADLLFDRMDGILGTNLKERVQDAQFKAAVEGVYKTPSAFGSGSVAKDALQGGVRQARNNFLGFLTAGTVVGAPFGPVVAAKVGTTAGIVGAVRGFAKGAKDAAKFSSPENLVKNFSKIKNKLNDIDQGLIPKTAAQGARSLPGQVSAQVDQPVADAFVEGNTDPGLPPVAAQNDPAQEPEDPFARFRGIKLNTTSLGQ